MIVRILSRGKSFKGLAAYLTHDPKAQTAERVGWTHTLNLANDHVPSAVNEMLMTARHAELLKQEAGIRAGGRTTENTVKHLSLNWAPEDRPSREHMIEATEGFLRHMGWQDHQAVLVAHDDKAFAHVHAMVNVVHPETGLRLNDDFERRRAQEWALGYEREQGRIHCEQRLMNIGEREQGPTRPAWMAFKEKHHEFERDEKSRRDQEPILLRDAENPKIAPDDEWKKLKEIQRAERLEFFASGKSEFAELRRAVYREVRADFRERWCDFYAAQKDGGDLTALAAMKAELIAEQKAALETRRDEACGALKETRGGLYREMLDDQRDARLGLRWRQEAGLDNALFLEQAKQRNIGKDRTDGFRESAEAATARQEERRELSDSGWAKRGSTGVRSGTDVGARVSLGLGFGLLSLFAGLDSDSKPDVAPRRPEPEPVGPSPPEAPVIDAHSRQQRAQEEEDWERRQRERSYARE